MKVLFVEDEKLLADALKHLLEQNGIEADLAYDGSTGNILALNGDYDVIILDVMLPGNYDGLDILKNIRVSGSKTPVMMLTAKDSLQDKVLGLDLGADDYLVKPFEGAELVARIKALMRRYDSLSSADQQQLKKEEDSFELLHETSEILVGDKRIPLTHKELTLLEFLRNNKGHPKSKAEIIKDVWGEESGIAENSVELYIHYLRKKLENSGISIRTIRGQGYLIE